MIAIKAIEYFKNSNYTTLLIYQRNSASAASLHYKICLQAGEEKENELKSSPFIKNEQ